MSFFATGAQPAEALPASTLGYASVDLDPSGGQKIEAFRMLEKFPAIEKELGGFDADDDLLEKVFEELEKECDGSSYEDDVKPWLGYRFAAAAVDLGEEMPTPVGVLQVTDADAAEEGLATLAGLRGQRRGRLGDRGRLGGDRRDREAGAGGQTRRRRHPGRRRELPEVDRRGSVTPA